MVVRGDEHMWYCEKRKYAHVVVRGEAEKQNNNMLMPAVQGKAGTELPPPLWLQQIMILVRTERILFCLNLFFCCYSY